MLVFLGLHKRKTKAKPISLGDPAILRQPLFYVVLFSRRDHCLITPRSGASRENQGLVLVDASFKGIEARPKQVPFIDQAAFCCSRSLNRGPFLLQDYLYFWPRRLNET